MNKYMIRWTQIQPVRDEHWAYDWPLVLTESLKLVVIFGTTWWVLVSLFPSA